MDMVVPGLLLIPKNRKGPAPVVVALHGHGSSKESVCTDTKNSQLAITGGTGAYSHARGWMQLNSLAGGTQYDFIFHLIP